MNSSIFKNNPLVNFQPDNIENEKKLFVLNLDCSCGTFTKEQMDEHIIKMNFDDHVKDFLIKT